MAEILMKICSASLVIRGMEIKITVRYYLTPVRMASIKKTRNNSLGRDVEEKEPLHTVVKDVNWCSHSGKQYGSSSKN